MKKSLFESVDYKKYLHDRLIENGARSGAKAKLAQAVGVQSSYLSQVLHGQADLTLEQAFRANAFFQHDSSESHFFLLLVQREKAGTVELKNYFEKQMKDLRQEREKIKNRLHQTGELDEKVRTRYYSSWDYIAIHMALSVPELRTASRLAAALSLPIERVEAVLQFLVQNGLARSSGGEYDVGNFHLHLEASSPLIYQHHLNWRLETLRRLQFSPQERQLNYSAVFSVSRQDYTRLRENLLKLIQENLAVVKPSQDEIIVCQTLDLFPLTP